MMSRAEVARVLGIGWSATTLWGRQGRLGQLYRESGATNSPILYDARSISQLRGQIENESNPYPDPLRPGLHRVPIRTLEGLIFAIIDSEDAPKVAGRRWGYTQRTDRWGPRAVVVQVGKRRTTHVPLKRLIAGVEHEPHTIVVTHANGDALDCRRANLVVRDGSERNGSFAKRRGQAGRPCTSRFKGVHWSEREGKWIVQICTGGGSRRVGAFDAEEDAAEAYDEAARMLFKEHARVNFPRRGERPTAVRQERSAA
jgi:hypothetical protein